VNPQKPTRIRWAIVFLAFLGTAINYIDRANLGVAEMAIREQLHLSKAQMGLVLSAFFWTYAVCQLPAGWLVDRLGARATYAFACLWWSAFTALTAFGQGFWSLLVCRCLLGIGEAGAYPSNAKATAEWFPRQERAFASAFFDSGSRIGTAVALPVVGLVIASFGWRYSFAVTGALGLVWAAVWIAFYRSPSQHRFANAAEVAYIAAGGGREAKAGTPASTLRWRDLFRYRTVLGMAAGFFCLTFVNYFFITWFPTYLREARGFTLRDLGTYGMIPPLVATLGGWLGGLVSDRLVKSGMSLTRARKLPILFGLGASSSIALAAGAETAFGAIAWLSVSYAGISFAAASVWALPGDVAPTPAHVGSIGGIQNFASNAAGIVLPPLVGLLLDLTGNDYRLPLFLAGAAGITGAAIYWFVVGTIEPLQTTPPSPVENPRRAKSLLGTEATI
jgi:D-galactonate transporter